MQLRYPMTYGAMWTASLRALSALWYHRKPEQRKRIKQLVVLAVSSQLQEAATTLGAPSAAAGVSALSVFTPWSTNVEEDPIAESTDATTASEDDGLARWTTADAETDVVHTRDAWAEQGQLETRKGELRAAQAQMRQRVAAVAALATAGDANVAIAPAADARAAFTAAPPAPPAACPEPALRKLPSSAPAAALSITTRWADGFAAAQLPGLAAARFPTAGQLPPACSLEAVAALAAASATAGEDVVMPPQQSPEPWSVGSPEPDSEADMPRSGQLNGLGGGSDVSLGGGGESADYGVRASPGVLAFGGAQPASELAAASTQPWMTKGTAAEELAQTEQFPDHPAGRAPRGKELVSHVSACREYSSCTTADAEEDVAAEANDATTELQDEEDGPEEAPQARNGLASTDEPKAAENNWSWVEKRVVEIVAKSYDRGKTIRDVRQQLEAEAGVTYDEPEQHKRIKQLVVLAVSSQLQEAATTLGAPSAAAGVSALTVFTPWSTNVEEDTIAESTDATTASEDDGLGAAGKKDIAVGHTAQPHGRPAIGKCWDKAFGACVRFDSPTFDHHEPQDAEDGSKEAPQARNGLAPADEPTAADNNWSWVEKCVVEIVAGSYDRGKTLRDVRQQLEAEAGVTYDEPEQRKRIKQLVVLVVSSQLIEAAIAPSAPSAAAGVSALPVFTMWSDAEYERFALALASHGKDMRAIAKQLGMTTCAATYCYYHRNDDGGSDGGGSGGQQRAAGS
ncbi:hypothetical protein T492DRAFT_855554 [Pavlovales sp. CCMP2436]|nr:hypothetical protein T492DRAFT_855554 [Pavlovales sp. CCMP2436]